MKEMFNKHFSLIVKFLLILSILNSINLHLWHIASANIFLLIMLFTPQLIKSGTKLKIPTEFEFLLLIFIALTFLLGKIKGIIAPMIFGAGIGLIALLILLKMYNSNQIKKNYFLILSYSFSFSLAIATLIELAKYYLKILLDHELCEGLYMFTLQTFTYVLIGSVLACIIGYIYMTTQFKHLKKIIKKLKLLNPEIFKKQNSIEDIVDEIKEGESETQEFKSTLRTNLYTNEKDKKIEQSVLKTICAFLNTKGGSLYIGITDEQKILGIEKDNFENKDKFELHLTNLIKQKISKKYLRLINIESIKIKERTIFKITIKKSKTPAFLKDGNEEYFYIRIGPQSVEVKGSELIEYIERRFNKK